MTVEYCNFFSDNEEPIQTYQQLPDHPSQLATTFQLVTGTGFAISISINDRNHIFAPRLQKLFVVIPGYAATTTDDEYERLRVALFQHFPAFRVGVLGVDWNIGGSWKQCEASSETACVYCKVLGPVCYRLIIVSL